MEWVKEKGFGCWWWWWEEEDMLVLRSGKGFLYGWIGFETQLVTPVCGGLRLEPIHHVTESSPSILRDIASFSTNRGYILG